AEWVAADDTLEAEWARGGGDMPHFCGYALHDLSAVVGKPDAAASTVTAPPTSILADGVTTSTITVTLRDANGLAVSGKTVSLTKASGPGAPVITAVSGTTSDAGVATFTVASTTAGEAVFRAKDETDGVVVTQTAAVTFFALPFLTAQPARLQDSGDDHLLVLEAEHYDRSVPRSDLEWLFVNGADALDFSGEGAMQVPNTGLNVNINIDASPELDYKVKFVAAGLHYVWVRGLTPNLNPDGTPGGSDGNDSVNTGLDGFLLGSSDRITGFISSYTWKNTTADGPVATINIASAGEHHFNLFMREDGFVADKILLTTNPNYVPVGKGPDESPRGQVIISMPGGVPTFVFPTDASRQYRMVYKNNLITDPSWTTVTQTWTQGTGSNLTLTDTSASLPVQRFYRIEMQ
ncbi:MAG: invasin domain 3-containing protein, partial [Verrucomicrobiota bacterium]